MSRSRRLDAAAVAIVIVLAAAWRIPALLTDPWLDELWSLSFALRAGSALDVLGLAHDNNHYLNTLFMWLLGNQATFYPYRLLSLVTGLLAIPVAMRVVARDGRMAAIVTGLLFAFSYLMAVYGSEARGYAPAILCGLGTILVLDAPRPGPGRIAAAWALTLLGFASQLTFGFLYLAVLVWSAWRVLRAGPDRPAAVRRLLACHAVPLLAVGAFAALTVPRMAFGGGPRLAVLDVLHDTVTWMLGLPTAPLAAALGAALVVAVLVLDTRLLLRRGSDLWVLDLVAILAPVLAVAAVPPPQLYPRYLLMSVTVFLLAFGRVLGDLLQRRGVLRLLAAGTLVVVCAGNVGRLIGFLRDGRGHYTDALRYVVDGTGAGDATVAANDDFDTLAMLGYYWPRIADGKRVHYFRHAEFPPQGTTWFLVRTYGPRPETRPVQKMAATADTPVVVYRLERVFPFDGGASGWHWSVYRRDDG